MAHLSSQLHRLALPLIPNTGNGWEPFRLFRGTTTCVGDLGCHISALDPAVTPHPPHQHTEEEILILMSGEADLILPEQEAITGTLRHRLDVGDLVYYPAGYPHSIEAAGLEPANYLMFKWRGDGTGRSGPLRFNTYSPISQAEGPPPAEAQAFSTRSLFEGPTRYLSLLHCHLTTLEPGAGYEEHVDPYDVAIVLLEGEIQVLGAKAGPQGVVFCAAGEPHGMLNSGESVARYLVFEFHGRTRFPWLRPYYWERVLRTWVRKHPRIKRVGKEAIRISRGLFGR